MGAVWNWAPVADALNGLSNQYVQQSWYNQALRGLFGSQAPDSLQFQGTQNPQLPSPTASIQGPNIPALPGGVAQQGATAQLPSNGTAPSVAMAPGMTGPLGQAPGANIMYQMLRNAPPQLGFPLLLQAAQHQQERQQEIQDRAVTPMSDAEAQSLGLRPGGKYGRDISGNIVTIQAPDTKSAAAIQQAEDMQRITPITDPNDPRLPPKNARPPGATYGVNAAGNVVETNLSDAKSPLALSQDLAQREAAIEAQMRMYGIGAPGSPSGPTKVDPASGSLQGQTGLSQAAINFLTTGQAPRGQAAYMAINNEIDNWAKANNINTATLKAQAKGYNDILTSNLQRNNYGKILENEIQGTIANLAPLSDAIGNGKVNLANVANVWLGKQVNDPLVLQYKDQLLRLQNELAGYNAVAGGKLNESGGARIDEGDLREAGNVLANGINSGGLKGLQGSIEMSTAKNRNVLGTAIDDANQGMWNLFGVGQNYKRQYGAPPPPTNKSGGGQQVQFHYDKNGNRIP